MAKQASAGKCCLCGQTFGGPAMTRHLARCTGGKETPNTAGNLAQQPEPCFHVAVRDGSGTYWMHLAVPLTATLRHLDRFLRDVWLECCGHLSVFSVASARYGSTVDPELRWRSMNVPAGRVLAAGMTFGYEYDMGSTTALKLKAVGLRQDGAPGGKIGLLARNDPPEIICEVCDNAPATDVCVQCLEGSPGAWLCDDCAADHDCDIEMLLPVVNSPRVGVCCYRGSGDDY